MADVMEFPEALQTCMDIAKELLDFPLYGVKRNDIFSEGDVKLFLDLSDQIQLCRRKNRFNAVAGPVASFVGGGMVAFGAVLIPATLGGSVALIGGGIGIFGGGIGMISADNNVGSALEKYFEDRERSDVVGPLLKNFINFQKDLAFAIAAIHITVSVVDNLKKNKITMDGDIGSKVKQTFSKVKAKIKELRTQAKGLHNYKIIHKIANIVGILSKDVFLPLMKLLKNSLRVVEPGLEKKIKLANEKPFELLITAIEELDEHYNNVDNTFFGFTKKLFKKTSSLEWERKMKLPAGTCLDETGNITMRRAPRIFRKTHVDNDTSPISANVLRTARAASMAGIVLNVVGKVTDMGYLGLAAYDLVDKDSDQFPEALADIVHVMEDLNRLFDGNVLGVQVAVSQDEKSIHVGDSGVELYFPPNSFNNDSPDHLIQMRIIPHCSFKEAAKSFTDCSSVMVELLPNNLRLRNPAVLTLPHCLIIKDCKRCRVRIFSSHHAEGENPVWEEITEGTRYVLTQSHCKIWLQRFCWIKYIIGDEEVEAKKLVLYTAGRRYKPEAKRVTIDVGYYPHLPGENERFLEKCHNQIIGCKQSFIFRRIPKDDLFITFTEAKPETWKIFTPFTETIQYSKIELSCEQSCFFTFSREEEEGTDLPYCIFSASQGEINSKLIIDMEHEPLELSTALDDQEKLDSQCITHEQRNMNMTAPATVHNNIKGDIAMIHPQPFPPYANISPVPHHQQALVPTPSVNQFSYQQTLLVSGMNDLSLSQYPLSYGVSFPSRQSFPLSGYHPSQEGTFPISYELMNELELKLGVKTTFNCNWTLLAEKLGFNNGEISYLEGVDKPTIEVLREAFSRGYFKTIDDLISILTEMKRIDVVTILSKHKKNTNVLCVD